MTHNITCIECPRGCAVEVQTESGNVVKSSGYGCNRGKVYAESEVVCPRRVVTSTVRTADGKIVPVKTGPIRKTEIFAIMEKIKAIRPTLPLNIGDVLIKNIEGDADLVVSGNPV